MRLSTGKQNRSSCVQKYTEPLGTLARLLIIAFHFYADDSQLWKIVNPKSKDDITSALQCLESAIAHIAT